MFIVGSKSSLWGFGRTYTPERYPDLEKVLFHFAWEKIRTEIQKGFLETTFEKVDINTVNMRGPCPVDPKKIPEPEDHSFEIDIDLYPYPEGENDPQSNSAISGVFISYSWDNEKHKTWVIKFAERIQSDGFKIVIDKKRSASNRNLPEFMDRGITDSTHVIIVCTENYIRKFNTKRGGVAYEMKLISAEVMENTSSGKFIPILRQGTGKTSIPKCLAGDEYFDFRGESFNEDNYSQILELLRNEKV